MRRLVYIILLSTLTIAQAFGQETFLSRKEKGLPTNKEWQDLKVKYNYLPTAFLKTIEKELDSTISAEDCFKFIHNPDTTKFVAFFLQERNDKSHSRLTHFGQVVHRHYRTTDNDSIEFYGYVIWGMKYEQDWHYDKDRENEFWDENLDIAKENFLFYVLDKVEYFKNKDEKHFWKVGGASNRFRVLSKGNSYLIEYAGLPEVVGWHKTSAEGRQEQLSNDKIEMIGCNIEDDLWNILHQADNTAFHTRYKSIYSGKSCLILYNSDRSKVLLPILYYDNQSKPYVTYYFAKINSTDTTLYRWTRFPTKRIKHKPGDESLEIVYDIRTCIENWNWGTVNMISNDSFWTDNFTNKDLQAIKK
jgi:hypothetical protein